MPRIALVVLGVLGGCSFEANYAGGVYPCSEADSKCPDGLVCDVNLDDILVCRKPRMDAAIDSPTGDAVVVDGLPTHQMNCMDPQPLSNGVGFEGSTKDRFNKVSAQCFSKSMYGLDAVHSITPGAGLQMTVVIQADFAATAYVLSACPATACNGNVYATPGNPITVYTLAGPHYIIVDSLASNVYGNYTLTVGF